MVFQSYALYPHMSVEENIGFGLRMNGMIKSDVRSKVTEAASILHVSLLRVKLGWYHFRAGWQWWSDDIPADFSKAGELARALVRTGLTPHNLPADCSNDRADDGIVMSGRAPADQGLFFGVALVASAVMSSAFFCGE
jgi:tagatose-1,6-bisphosphate aldolase non-catalytic subunit AgaZ/GatZ